MRIWRVAGIALMAGLALFLISLLVKLVLVTLATVLVIRVVGGQLASRFIGPMDRGLRQSAEIISIDNPAYRSFSNRANYDRIIPIN